MPSLPHGLGLRAPKGLGGGGKVTTRVQVIGVANAIRKLQLVGSIAGRDAGYIVFSTAAAIEKMAQELVHSPTHPGPSGPGEGHLQRGIKLNKLGKYDWTVTASSKEGGAEKEYAYYEEFGAHSDEGAPYGGHPYLRPAFAANAPRARAKLKILAKKLERI